MYDYKKAVLGSITTTAIAMQNDFLDKFREARPLGFIINTENNPFDVILKATYIALLTDVKDQIEKEIIKANEGE